MKTLVSLVAVLSVSLSLSACGSDSVKPTINFLGIGTGTLSTDVRSIHFSQTFKPTDQQLVGVVSFAQISEGTTVQATWFSPDDRAMPLGRTSIVTQSGAKIARFSFTSTELWRPAPYALRIDAISGTQENVQTASGTISFFIGMKDDEIGKYLQEYADWKEEERKKREVFTAKEQAEQALTKKAATILSVPTAAIVLRSDFTGSGSLQYFIVGQTKEEAAMPPGGGSPGVLYSGTPKGFVIMDGSGALLLASGEIVKGKHIIRDSVRTITTELPMVGDVQVAVLPSGTISMTWLEKKKTCTMEVRAGKGGIFVAEEKVCR